MRIGDIIGLPVNPFASEERHVYADAKVLHLFDGAKEVRVNGNRFVFEYINGPRDGFTFELTRAELDALLGREGGEDWKEGGA